MHWTQRWLEKLKTPTNLGMLTRTNRRLLNSSLTTSMSLKPQNLQYAVFADLLRFAENATSLFVI
jgi:hypothetical protein